jgi:adenylosuccinate lyase
VQPKAMMAWEQQRSFRDIIESDSEIRGQLSLEEIGECFDPSWHLKHVDTIFKRLNLI